MVAIANSHFLDQDRPVGISGPKCPQCRARMRLATFKPNTSHPYWLPIASFDCDCGRSVCMPWRPKGRRFVVMAGAHDELRRQFAVIIEPNGTEHVGWRWELKRMWKPLGVKLHNDGFFSAADAKSAGEKALLDFLEEMVQEQNARISINAVLGPSGETSMAALDRFEETLLRQAGGHVHGSRQERRKER